MSQVTLTPLEKVLLEADSPEDLMIPTTKNGLRTSHKYTDDTRLHDTHIFRTYMAHMQKQETLELPLAAHLDNPPPPPDCTAAAARPICLLWGSDSTGEPGRCFFSSCTV